ncbi:MAG: hypothetical protein ABFC63_05500 [Thermoguttaceae bacterium]
MVPQEPGDRRNSKLKARLLEALHNPTQLRVCVIGAILLIGYYAVFVPLDGRIAQTTRKLAQQRTILDQAANLEQLQKQYSVLDPRVPQRANSEEWVQYLLNGIRGMPVKMNALECREPKQFGPLKVFSFHIELEGTFFDLDKFLRWIESNRRLFRVDEVTITPMMGAVGGGIMRLTLLGLSG